MSSTHRLSLSYGWHYVGGIYSGFATHGYCASGASRWIVRITESIRKQHNIDGALHPNAPGHQFYAGKLRAALTANLYLNGDLAKPRVPNPPGP